MYLNQKCPFFKEERYEYIVVKSVVRQSTVLLSLHRFAEVFPSSCSFGRDSFLTSSRLSSASPSRLVPYDDRRAGLAVYNRSRCLSHLCRPVRDSIKLFHTNSFECNLRFYKHHMGFKWCLDQLENWTMSMDIITSVLKCF